MEPAIETWRDVDGDNTYALNWPLNEYSTVWEIGGFEGRWAQQILDKYNPFITIFEPQLWAAKKLFERFKGQKVEIRPYGLWIEDCVLPIGNYFTDGASIVKDDGREPTQLGAFMDYTRETDPLIKSDGYAGKIEVVLMNIEGAEYTLLPAMIKSDAIRNFSNFWCQFHPDENHSDSDATYIFQGMAKTHDLLWNFYPTAVAWRLRK